MLHKIFVMAKMRSQLEERERVAGALSCRRLSEYTQSTRHIVERKLQNQNMLHSQADLIYETGNVMATRALSSLSSRARSYDVKCDLDSASW